MTLKPVSNAKNYNQTKRFRGKNREFLIEPLITKDSIRESLKLGKDNLPALHEFSWLPLLTRPDNMKTISSLNFVKQQQGESLYYAENIIQISFKALTQN